MLLDRRDGRMEKWRLKDRGMDIEGGDMKRPAISMKTNGEES